MENNQISLNIYDYIVSKNHDAKDRIAIDYLGRKYTFKELLDNMNIVMQSLSEYGIKKGDSIMALTLATPEFIFLMYGAAKMGITLNILNPFNDENYDSIIARLNPKLLFCYDRFYTKILGKIDNKKIVITSPFDSLPLAMKLTGKIQKLSTNKECITYSEFISKGKKRAKKIEEDTADISNKKIIEIGTGCSTGIPKQVGISNEMLNNVVYQHEIMNKYSVFDVSFNDNETFLDIIPPHLAYGICDIHLALSLKLKLCLEPNPEPKLFVKQLKKYRPNHVLAGPVHWKQLIAYDKKIDLSYIKSAVAGGEHLECNDEIKTNQKLKESGSKVTVREGVGLTEICGVGTYNSTGDLFTVGKPLPEYQVGIFKVDINKEYNDNYGKDMNMNKIKAVLHNKVLTEMVKDNDYDYIVVDQFEPEKSYYNHLSDVPNPLKGITFITKAEDKCLSVAVSSLISRYIFIKEMDKLGDKYGIFLPKGANYYVEDVGIKLVNKYGEKILHDIAKLNFSNTDRILKEVRK